MPGKKNKSKSKSKNKKEDTANTTAPTMSDPAPDPAPGPAPPPPPTPSPPPNSFAPHPSLPPFSFDFGASSHAAPGPAPPAISLASGPGPSFSFGVPSELAPNSAPPTFEFGTSSEFVSGSPPDFSLWGSTEFLSGSPPDLPFGASSDVPQYSSQGFSFAAPAGAPSFTPLSNLAPVGAPFQGTPDFDGRTWKAKCLELEDEILKKENNLTTQINNLEGCLTSAVAERDTLTSRLEAVEKELKSAREFITHLGSVIDGLSQPESDDEGSLSGDESSMEPGTSNELEESYSCQDGATQTIKNLEEAAKERKMSQQIVDLEEKVKDLEKELEKAKTNADSDIEYISRTEKELADVQKKYDTEVFTSAEWKRQLDAEKKQVKQNATHIENLEQEMQEMAEEHNEDEKSAKRQLSLIADLRKEVEVAEKAVKFHKSQYEGISKENAELLEQQKVAVQGLTDQQQLIAKLKSDINQSEHLTPDLVQHQSILENALDQINKSIDEGPKFNAHPEAYVLPEGLIPATQTLSEDLAGISGVDLSSGGDGSSHESFESDSDSENNDKSILEGDDFENDTIQVEKQITLEERLSQALILEVEVKVPVEEITSIPAGSAPVPTPDGSLPRYAGTDTDTGPVVPPTPTGSESPPYVQPTVPTPPLTPEVIIKEEKVYIDRPLEVDRFVFLAPTVHSWLHIERDFLVLLFALYVTIRGTFFPWFIQEVRGTAPINANPASIQVHLPEDDEESDDEEPQNPAHIAQAQMMIAIPANTRSSPPTNGVAPGSDPSDTLLGSSATETADLVDLFSPLTPSLDTRESIPAAPLTAPPSGPNSSPSGNGNGNGDGAPPPGPPNGDGNGGPSGPPSPPIGDGNGSGAPPPPPAPVAVAAPGFWNIRNQRPLPSIFWTLVFMAMHCLVYFFIYISFSTYSERKIWLGANNATREYLNNIMGTNYNNGILRKIFSNNWARKIDRLLFFAITNLGMELKAFPMPG